MLASWATGYPIGKIAAKLAVGYLLDEIKSDITRETQASFEPTIDYVITNPAIQGSGGLRRSAEPPLRTKSAGEAMAVAYSAEIKSRQGMM